MNYWKISNLLGLVTTIVVSISQIHAQSLSIVDYIGKSEITLIPGKEETVELSFRVQNNFYIQGNKLKNEYFIPTSLNLRTSDGIAIGDIRYPEAIQYPYIEGDAPLDIYVNEITITVPVSLIVSIRSTNELRLTGSLYYQACSMSKCYYPRDLPFEVQINVVKDKIALSGR
jgi:hypothetical protein